MAAILAYLGDKSVDLLDTDRIKRRVVESGKTARKDALDKMRFSLTRKLLREIIGDLADAAVKDAENGEGEQPAPKEDPIEPAKGDASEKPNGDTIIIVKQ